MDEFEDEDDDRDLNSPLDVRYVIAGLLMMVSGLFTLALTQNQTFREVGALIFFASFFVMTKKQKQNLP